MKHHAMPYAAATLGCVLAAGLTFVAVDGHHAPRAAAASAPQPTLQTLNPLALYNYPEAADAYGQSGALVGLSANKGVAVDSSGNVDASTALGSVIGQFANPTTWQSSAVGLGNVLPSLTASSFTEQYTATNFAVSDTTFTGQPAVHFTADAVTVSGSSFPNLYLHVASPEILQGGTMTVNVVGNGTKVAERYKASSTNATVGVTTSDEVTTSSTPQAITIKIPPRDPSLPTTGNQTIFPIIFPTSQSNVDVTFFGLSLVPDVTAITGPTKPVAGAFSSTGSTLIGYSGDGGPATSAELNAPGALAFGPSGDLYVADTQNNRVRKIAPDGTITTIAGDGKAGFAGDGGPATKAELDNPESVAVDKAGDVFIADTYSGAIREVTPNGQIKTVAGSGNHPGFKGDGGPATRALLTMPEGVAVDTAGDLYIADSGNNRVRKITPSGVISTIAGNGTAGPASGGELDVPYAVAVDATGNVYIAEYAGNTIDRLGVDGTLSAVIGNGTAGDQSGAGTTSAEVDQPAALAIDQADGILYVASLHRIDEITNLITPTATSGTVTSPGSTAS